MLADGQGGFLACWGATDDPALGSSRILAQHYLASGSADPAWPAGGVLACAERPLNRGPWERIVTDGAGGFYSVWMDYRNSPSYNQYGEVDIYAQHVLGDGRLAAGWPEDGLVVCAIPGSSQEYPSLCEDGRGGLYVAWVDYRARYAQVFVSHIGSGGERLPGWPPDGRLLSTEVVYQLDPKLASDGVGGVYVTWMNYGDIGYRAFIQHLWGNGQTAPGWAENGVAVASTPGLQANPAITSDGAGGAIVAWEDTRTYSESNYDIYAQRFVRDGVVSAQVSLVRAEVMGRAVHLRWQVSGEMRATLERRTDAGAWEMRTSLDADGSGYVSFIDTEVMPGTDYRYRLAFADGAHGGETEVRVPASLTLALAGARPNPASGWPTLAFTLPDDSPATLALHDIGGRRVAMREVGALGAGAHVLRPGEGALAPGLYWASLTRGGQTLRARVVVTR